MGTGPVAPRITLSPALSSAPPSPVLPEILIGLVAGLITGILIAWYRKTTGSAT